MRISLDSALELIREALSPLAPVNMPLGSALGMVSAESLTSEIDQPPFPRSPYDGYAFRAEDSFGASAENPVMLKIVGVSYAGTLANVAVESGEAVRIMTGGAVPDGANCIVKQENTTTADGSVLISEPMKPYQNYCHRGEDFHAGDLLFKGNTKITAAAYAVAASAGCCELRVFPKPRVAIISTGGELQEPGSTLEYGHIYNSNAAYLSSRLTELAVPSQIIGTVRDETEEIKASLEKAMEDSELVICSGGVSVGEKDLVPLALEQLGAKIIFHGVAIKPGMPAAFATLRGKSVLALSGNPFACAVSFELLARTVIAALASDPSYEPRIVKAALSGGFARERPVRRFHRAVLKNGMISIPGGQGNGQLRTMIGCNCLVELPAGNEPILAGAPVNAYLLEGGLYGF